MLDAGRVVQRGTREELVAQPGVHAELYRTQLENLGSTRTAQLG